MNTHRPFLMGGCSILSLALAGVVHAQTTNTGTAAAGVSNAPVSEISEVIVTARKRAEDINKVPIAITAYTGAELAKRNITTFADLANNTPGVSYGAVTGGAAGNLVFRGVAPANKNAGLNVEANVGIFIDGIYQASRNSVTNLSLIDIGSLEIVKGPQSALYGRSTFAGALNITTEAPSHVPSFDMSATVGSDDDLRVRASASGPIIEDVLYGRFGASYARFDGTVTNPAAKDNNLGGFERGGVSGQLEYHPTKRLTAVLSGYLTRSNDELLGISILPYTANTCGGFQGSRTSGTNAFLGYCGEVPVPKVAGYAPPLSPAGNTGLSTNLPDSKNLNGQLALNVKYDFDNFSVLSLSGFNQGTNDTYNDYDGTSIGDYYGVCPVAVGGAPTAACIANPTRYVYANALLHTRDTTKAYSQEFRIQSRDGARFRWLGGAYYSSTKVTDYVSAGVTPTTGGTLSQASPGGMTALGALANLTEVLIQVEQPTHAAANAANGEINADINSFAKYASSYHAKNDTYAFFGSLGYDITSWLKVNAEARYNSDTKLLNTIGSVIGTQKTEFTSFTPKFTIEYQYSPSIFIYASAGKGVHSGGFNPVVVSTSPGLGALPNEVVYNEESNWTYELGTKARFFGNRLTVNADLFKTDWSDVQVSGLTQNPTVASGTRVGIISNAGNMTVYGFEGSADFRVNRLLTVGGNFTYAHSRFDKGAYDAGKVSICGLNVATGLLTANSLASCKIIAVPGTVTAYEPSIAGNSPANTPEFQFNLHALLSGEWVSGWNWNARLDFNHTDSLFTDNLNLSTYGERNLLNLNLGLQGPRYGVSFFVSNLTDDSYISYIIAQPRVAYNFNQSAFERYIGEGRRYGVTVTAKF